MSCELLAIVIGQRLEPLRYRLVTLYYGSRDEISGVVLDLYQYRTATLTFHQ